MHGRANGNGKRFALLCQETVPQRRHPNHKIFSAIDRRFRGTGTFNSFAVNRGRERSVGTPDVQERILDSVEEIRVSA
jgi:hypothetical protein